MHEHIYCDVCGDETSSKDACLALEEFGSCLCYDCQKVGATHRFVCNGYTFNKPKFSTRAREMAIGFIDELRPEIRKLMSHESGMWDGWRFGDYDAAIIRIESVTTEEDFIHYPKRWCKAALIDCAQSDYWYQFEKDWGTDYPDLDDQDSKEESEEEEPNEES